MSLAIRLTVFFKEMLSFQMLVMINVTVLLQQQAQIPPTFIPVAH